MSSLHIADPDKSYRDQVIERLKKLLAQARKGEIISMAYVCERPGATVTIGSTRIKDRYVLIGYLMHSCFMTSLSLHESSTEETLISGSDQEDCPDDL